MAAKSAEVTGNITVDEVDETAHPPDSTPSSKKRGPSRSPEHLPDKTVTHDTYWQGAPPLSSSPPAHLQHSYQPQYTPGKVLTITDLSGPTPQYHQHPTHQIPCQTTMIPSCQPPPLGDYHQSNTISNLPYTTTHHHPIMHPPVPTPMPATPSTEPPWVSKIMSIVKSNRDELMLKIDDVNARVSKIESEIKSVIVLNKQVAEMEEGVKFLSANHDSFINQLSEHKKITDSLECHLNEQVDVIKEELLHDKCFSMRDNLVFHNIGGDDINESQQKSEQIVRGFVQQQMNIPMDNVEIMRCHRLGDYKPNKHRPIVAKFLKHKQKEHIRKSSSTLKSTTFGVSDQYPAEIIKRRQLLMPIFKDCKKQKGPHSASLVVDKLYTEDCTYSVKNNQIIKSPPSQRRRQRPQENRNNHQQHRHQQTRQNDSTVQHRADRRFQQNSAAPPPHHAAGPAPTYNPPPQSFQHPPPMQSMTNYPLLPTPVAQVQHTPVTTQHATPPGHHPFVPTTANHA